MQINKIYVFAGPVTVETVTDQHETNENESILKLERFEYLEHLSSGWPLKGSSVRLCLLVESNAMPASKKKTVVKQKTYKEIELVEGKRGNENFHIFFSDAWPTSWTLSVFVSSSIEINQNAIYSRPTTIFHCVSCSL